ncbi:MAG: adenylate/guanylate cyclase domain-containing protein, partial [Burkholderiaceae bacterium]|nr:adenylate/guanylate cyclase domain-containing protein [Burkholderiaceae bacterium]
MRRIRWFLLCIALGAAAIASYALPDAFASLEHALDDWRLRAAVQHHPESRLVIVDIDERSLNEQGAWPWPRATMSQLLRTLIDDYGVAGVAIDVVFPEARPDDALLAAQIGRPQITTAIVYDLEQRPLQPLRQALPPGMPFDATAGAPRPHGQPVVANHAGLASQTAGHITPLFDSDGVVRRIYPLICADEPSSGRPQCHASLVLAAFAGLMDGPRMYTQAGNGLFAPPWELVLQDEAGGTLATLPLMRDGALAIPYRHTKADWVSISAVDILQRKPDPELLRGVMVLLGGTALGLSDVISTPQGGLAAGIEPHAEILSAVLDNEFFAVPQYGRWIDILLLLPFAALLAWVLERYRQPAQRAVALPLWLALTWGAGGFAGFALLRQARLLVPLSPLFLFPPLALLLVSSAEIYRAGRERAGVFSLLTAYLPRQVAQRLTETDPGGERISSNVDAARRNITVLFADINGFAALCENLAPETVASFTQRVFTEMAEAVVAHRGTIDKFIGDAVMAFWNAPDDDAGHASHALAAAQEIQRRIEALAPCCATLGIPPVGIGIGIETGE